MQTSTPFDCYFHIRPEIWENPIPSATSGGEDQYDIRYEGIYNVIVNRVITIVFCPKINKVDVDQIIRSEMISTEDEARYLTVALADYSILPDPILAGQEAVLPNPLYPEDPMVIFYVSEKDFNRFIQEMKDGPVAFYVNDDDVSDQNFDRFMQKMDIAPFKELTFLKFIVER